MLNSTYYTITKIFYVTYAPYIFNSQGSTETRQERSQFSSYDFSNDHLHKTMNVNGIVFTDILIYCVYIS